MINSQLNKLLNYESNKPLDLLAVCMYNKDTHSKLTKTATEATKKAKSNENLLTK